MIYPTNMRRSMGGGQVPDESQLETRMWFYYQAVSYIVIGCEAIHFGQVEIMGLAAGYRYQCASPNARQPHGNVIGYPLVFCQ